MSRDDWYRNGTWNELIEAEFQQRLRRARDKSQYLRIQAGCLASSFPEAALRLIEQYFELGDHFDKAQAFVDQARAFISLGKIENALDAYVHAIEREAEYPQLQTIASLEFVKLVAIVQDENRYDLALQITDRDDDPPRLPISRYEIFGARALILFELNQREMAKEALDLALAAAGEIDSGFRNHKNFGLVRDMNDEFGRRIAAIASLLHVKH